MQHTRGFVKDETPGADGTRSFTYDAAGNVTYDNRSGQGYGYTYDTAGRMASFSLNGIRRGETLPRGLLKKSFWLGAMPRRFGPFGR